MRIFSTLFLLSITSNCLGQSSDEALNTVDAYIANRNAFCKICFTYTANTQIESHWDGRFAESSGSRNIHEKGEFAYDGKRFSIRYYRWGNVQSPKEFITEDQSLYNSYNWDEKQLTVLTKPSPNSGLVNHGQIISFEERDVDRPTPLYNKGAVVFGLFDDGPIDELLREAKSISAKSETIVKRASSLQCDVIQGKTRFGDVRVGICKSLGNSLAFASVTKVRDDLFSGKPLSSDQKHIQSLESVEFEDIDGLWVPRSAVIVREDIYGNGNYSNEKSLYEINDIEINPDFEKRRSFFPDDIPDGTIMTKFESETSLQYTWNQGNLVPRIDDKIESQIVRSIDSLSQRKKTQVISAMTSSTLSSEKTKNIKEAHGVSRSAANLKHISWFAGLFLALAAGALWRGRN